MSIGYVRAVMQNRNPVGLHRLLLMVIAEHANRETGIASPGNELLSEETAISVRHIRRMIPELVAAGFIEIVQEGRGRGIVRQMLMLFEPAFDERKEARQSSYERRNGDNQSGFMTLKEDKKGTEKGTEDAIKGDRLPEVEADNQLQPLEPITTTAGVECLDPVIAVQTSQTQPLPVPPPVAHPIDLDLPKPPTEAEMAQRLETTVSVTPNKYKLNDYEKYLAGPHMKGAKVVRGYVAPGTGTNAVQVFHERHSAADDKLRLTDPQQDDLMKAVTDTEQWRKVVIACDQKDHRPKNFDVRLEWYRNGIPNGHSAGSKYNAATNNGRITGSNSGTGAQQPGAKSVPDWIFVPRPPDPNAPF